MKRRIVETLDSLLESFGIAGTQAPRSQSQKAICAHGPSRSGAKVLVGRLTVEGASFVFSYDERYRTNAEPPITGFPDLDVEYRRKRLWPFFEVRLPPRDREDVTRVLAERGVDPADPLDLLALLGARTPTSPYTLEIEEPTVGPRRRLAPAT